MLQEMDFRAIRFNPHTLFSECWAALVAGSERGGANAMTIAWGMMGSLWNFSDQGVAAVYVRESRHTKRFMDREAYFSINVLPEELRSAHAILGAKSGRDIDKWAASGLTPTFEDGCCYIAESDQVFICKKIYAQPLDEALFLDASVPERNYRDHDLHTQYFGRIVKTLVREAVPPEEGR